MRKAVFTISFLLSFLAVQAQEAKVLFDSIPESVLPLLSPVNRADFIDFLESNMKAEVKNKFSGTSEMTDLSADYIRIQMTERSIWEMKTLSVNDSTTVICVVSTTCAPVCDSDVRFYTSDWKEVSVPTYLILPELDDYFQLTDSTRFDDYTHFRSKMDMLLVKATLSKDENTLTFTLTTPEYIGDSEADDERPIKDTELFLREPFVYTWEYNPSTATHQFKRKETGI